ncbi:hypothetical protein SLEP1_g42415 [Rubroshorea leprosula]|uniref:Uncharacterized protein n=1 Tax=Rubroshorea leprosula TaxID=152421 RepID=A0AAV5LAM6_9ROSI|nr:hypothetical protein SLEP1_g42415 [Rubroshorea leprosula]
MKPIRSPNLFTALRSWYLISIAAAYEAQKDGTSSSFTFDDKGKDKDDSLYVKSLNFTSKSETTSFVTMSMSFMTWSIVGKRFYKKVTTRESNDEVGWLVMLDYRMLKTPFKRLLKLPTLALAKAIAVEWEY